MSLEIVLIFSTCPLSLFLNIKYSRFEIDPFNQHCNVGYGHHQCIAILVIYGDTIKVEFHPLCSKSSSLSDQELAFFSGCFAKTSFLLILQQGCNITIGIFLIGLTAFKISSYFTSIATVMTTIMSTVMTIIMVTLMVISTTVMAIT